MGERRTRPTGPWSCRRCRRLVSTRGNHWVSWDCRPADPPPRQDVMPRPGWCPPWQAWPPAHIHEVDRREVLSSPVPGLGPRLVAALAGLRRHSVRRLGPTAALRAVLADGPAAYERALHAPVHIDIGCSGEQHEVVVSEGELATPEHGDGDLAEIAALLVDAELPACLELARHWRGDPLARVELHDGPWRWRAQLDTARQWQRVGRPLVEVDAFIGLLLGPADIAAAAAVGLDEDEVLRWSPVSTDVGRAAAWRSTGWTVREAQELETEGYDPAGGARLRALGLDVRRAREADQERLDPETAARWYDAGWRLVDCGRAARAGLDPDDLAHLRGAGPETVGLHVAGVDEDVLARLTARGLSRADVGRLTEEHGLVAREIEHALDTVSVADIRSRVPYGNLDELARAAALAATSGMGFDRCLESVVWELDECPDLRWRLYDEDEDLRTVRICGDVVPLPLRVTAATSTRAVSTT